MIHYHLVDIYRNRTKAPEGFDRMASVLHLTFRRKDLFITKHLCSIIVLGLILCQRLMCWCYLKVWRGHRGHDRMVVGLATTCVISTDHH